MMHVFLTLNDLIDSSDGYLKFAKDAPVNHYAPYDKVFVISKPSDIDDLESHLRDLGFNVSKNFQKFINAYTETISAEELFYSGILN